MDPGHVIVWLAGLLAGFGWPVGLIWVILRHREKMKALELKALQGPQALAEEVAALRRELAQLRDTTTKFDMGFDAAIDRLDSRMDRVEQVSAGTAAGSEDVYRATVYEQTAAEIRLRQG